MINIAGLLRNAPKGFKLYSPLFGEVEFAEVMDTDYVPIRVMKRGYGLRFDEYGRYMGNEYPDSECLLFPSKDCRTWEGWKLPVEPKFKVGDDIKYDISNFHAGMPVLVRDGDDDRWKYVIFSHTYDGIDGKTYFNACGWTWDRCIPFNDETKHLLGTTDMCDERFINW